MSKYNHTTQVQILIDLIWTDWQTRKTPEGIYATGYQGIGNAQIAAQLGIYDKGEEFYREKIQRLMTLAVPIFAKAHPGHSLHRDGGGLARVVVDVNDPKPYKSDRRRLRTIHTLARRKLAGLNHVPGNSIDPAQWEIYMRSKLLLQQLEALEIVTDVLVEDQIPVAV